MAGPPSFGPGGPGYGGYGGSDTPDYADDNGRKSKSRSRRGPAPGARGGTGGQSRAPAITSMPERSRAAVYEAQTRRAQAPMMAKRREEARTAYRALVSKRADEAATVGRGLAMSSPITGPLGLLASGAATSASWLVERELEGKTTLGFGGLAMSAMGLPSEDEFITAFEQGLIDRSGKATAAGRQAAEEGRAGGLPRSIREVLAGGQPDASRAMPEQIGEAQPAPMRAQARVRPPAPATGIAAEEQGLEQILAPQAMTLALGETGLPGAGAPTQPPAWLRRLRTDVDRARRAGQAEAFI